MVLPWRPKRVLLSHDRSCNLSCPSCRREILVADKDEVARLNELFETTLAPLLRDADSVHVTGSGDAFGSAHFRYVLKRLNRREFPRLRLMLQTNGVLCDRRAWKELELEGLVSSVLVSIDAATKPTYSVVRRGGSFERLLDNLAFIAELRRERRISYFRLDFVVQALNFREMPAVVELARAFGCDIMHFQMIRNWGTFSLPEYRRNFIGAPDHPEYAEFLEVLRHPNLALPMVELSSVRRMRDYALQHRRGRGRLTRADPDPGVALQCCRSERRRRGGAARSAAQGGRADSPRDPEPGGVAARAAAVAAASVPAPDRARGRDHGL